MFIFWRCSLLLNIYISITHLLDHQVSLYILGQLGEVEGKYNF